MVSLHTSYADRTALYRNMANLESDSKFAILFLYKVKRKVNMNLNTPFKFLLLTFCNFFAYTIEKI